MIRGFRLALSAIAALALLGANCSADPNVGQVYVNFGTSAKNAEAIVRLSLLYSVFQLIDTQSAFQLGVAHLHNYGFGDARAAFVRARNLESQAGGFFWLTYWGEALAYFEPFYGQPQALPCALLLSRVVCRISRRCGWTRCSFCTE